MTELVQALDRRRYAAGIVARDERVGNRARVAIEEDDFHPGFIEISEGRLFTLTGSDDQPVDSTVQK